jgi:hypothetical protein
MKVHLVLYSNNEPFDTTKKLIIDSITDFCSNTIIVHDYNLERIKGLYWFYLIETLLSIDKPGKRDGYYNAWKPYITQDVYNKMDEGDILYYVDCSKYYKTGFTENIDKICSTVLEKGIIAGSVGADILNKSKGCCDNLSVWDKIIPGIDNSLHLEKMHVLNSWFILKKSEINTKFIDDWTYFSTYTDGELNDPLITYHHTVDQSIFNILVYKYRLPVFFSETIKHDENKNRNTALNIINKSQEVDEYLIYLQ